MSWATPQDVADAWIGTGYPDDPTRVQLWIDKAERYVRSQVTDLQARIDAQADEDPPRTDLLDDAVDVVVAMVTRVFRNPLGIRQENETTGPFTSSRTYGGDIPGGLALSDDELARLQGSKIGGAFTIDLMPSTSIYAGEYDPLWWAE